MSHYRFGPFALDTSRRELRRDGVPLELPPKAFDVIVYLLEHRERAVGRDELIAGVWGRVDVSDNVLDQIVLRARRTLDDRGETRRYIATRPRFGFAWMAPVDVVDGAAAVAAAGIAGTASADADVSHDAVSDADAVRVDLDLAGDAAAPASAVRPDAALTETDDRRATNTSRQRIHRGSRVLIASLALIALLSIGYVLLPRPAPPPVHSSTPATQQLEATLVLPFDVDTGAEAGWARLGLMDLVAQRLRDAGADVLPSDNAIALARGHAPLRDDAAARTVAASAGAVRTVRGAVRVENGRWHVALRALTPDAEPLLAEATAADPLQAAREASDRLALSLGLRVPALGAIGDTDLALRLQRIDAAILGDALDDARRELSAMTPTQRALPQARQRAASVLFRSGELDAAQRELDSLLDNVSAADDPELRGTVLNTLGNLALRRGDAPLAERRAEDAIALLAPLRPSPALGRAYTGRAIARSTQGRYATALDDFALARVVLDGAGDRLGIARIDTNVGILDARRDHVADAEPVLAAAADRLAAFNDLTNELYARVTLAQVRLQLLDAPAALSGEARLRELVQREPNAERRRYANLTRADVLAANGLVHDAADLLDTVRADAGAAGDLVLLGAAQALGAAFHVGAADPATAAREARIALNAPWAEESPRAFAATWWLLVRSLRDAGDDAAAIAAFDGFETWADSREEAAPAALLALARADISAAGPDTAAARAAFDAALAAADATRVPQDLLRVSERYVPWLLAQSDSAAAAVIAGRATRWADRSFDAALLSARLQQHLGHVDGLHAALAQARRLAGERSLPRDLLAAGERSHGTVGVQ